MPYFIFSKNSDNVDSTIYRIAANEFDLNNLNISKEDYKIIQDSNENFNFVKLNLKLPFKYNNNSINFLNQNMSFKNKDELSKYINELLIIIKNFLENNANHTLFDTWNTYYNQLNSLNYDLITFPLNKSLEQYFSDLGQPFYNILQLP